MSFINDKFRLASKNVLYHLLLIAGFVLLSTGVFLMSEGIYRLQMPYNELGKYFDASAAVVYQEDASTIYLGLGIIACFAAASIVRFSFRSINSQRKLDPNR